MLPRWQRMATQSHSRRSAAPTLGQILTAARLEKIGEVSDNNIAKKLYANGFDVSSTAIGSYHADEVQKPDIEIVLALVDLYDIAWTDLPPEIFTRCARLQKWLGVQKSSNQHHRYAPIRPHRALAVVADA